MKKNSHFFKAPGNFRSFWEHPQKALSFIVKEASGLCGNSYSAILLFDPSTGDFELEASYGKEKPKFLFPYIGNVVRRGKVVRFSSKSELTKSNFKSELAIPLEQDGHFIGLLYLGNKKENYFSSEDEIKIHDWIKQSMRWMALIWEVDHLRFKNQQFEALLNVGKIITSQDSLSYVLDQTVKDVCRFMKGSLGAIMLLSEDGTQLELAASYGASKEYLRRPNLSVQDSLVGVVIRRQKPIFILNVQKDSRYHYSKLAKKQGLVSFLSVPLIFKEQSLGVLSVYTDTQHRFSDEEVRLMTAMADLSAVAIAKAQFMEKSSRLEEELKSAERLSALGWLAAEVAHEIRNPLTVMQMLFHSLSRSVALDKSEAHDAALIKRKMQEMNRIVEQVLTFAKSSEPCMEPVNVESMLDDIILLVRHKFAEQNIQIKKTIDSSLPSIRGDRAQLEQAILNPVLNACHAMPKGGQLHFSASSEKTSVVLKIKDSGEGISLKIRKTLFQPLISYRKGGLGVGLALVRKTIELHQGSIQCKSQVGKGTTFIISLPKAKD